MSKTKASFAVLLLFIGNVWFAWHKDMMDVFILIWLMIFTSNLSNRFISK